MARWNTERIRSAGDEAVAERLWVLSQELIGTSFPLATQAAESSDAARG